MGSSANSLHNRWEGLGERGEDRGQPGAQGTGEAPPGLGSSGSPKAAEGQGQSPVWGLTPKQPGPSLRLLVPRAGWPASVMGGWELPLHPQPPRLEGEGQGRATGAPGPSEELKGTQNLEQKRPKGFYSVSPGEGPAERQVSTGGGQQGWAGL